MLTYPEIDPVAFSLGPLTVHWYGLTYLVGFVGGWALGVYRSKQAWSPVTKKQVEDLLFFVALGVVLGGRLGYVFLYNFGQFLEDPLWLFRVWEGGMAFHGGLIGVVVAVLLFAKKTNNKFIDVMDFCAPLVTIGLGSGRIGNFIGQELWGRASDVPWAMVFPKAGDGIARHPSQLYQAFLEGLVLFLVMFWFSSKPRPRAAISSLFLIVYGIFRFFVEFFREKDAHIDYIFDWMTRGQLLCIPMVLIGLAIFIISMTSKTNAQLERSQQKTGKANS